MSHRMTTFTLSLITTDMDHNLVGLVARMDSLARKLFEAQGPPFQETTDRIGNREVDFGEVGV